MPGLRDYIVPQPDVGDFIAAERLGRQDRQQQDQQTALSKYLPKALAGGAEANDAIAQLGASGGTNLALIGPLMQHVERLDDRGKQDAANDAVAISTAFQGWNPANVQEVEPRRQAALAGLSPKAREAFSQFPPDQIQAAIERSRYMPAVIAADRAAQEFMLGQDVKRANIRQSDASAAASYAQAAKAKAEAAGGGVASLDTGTLDYAAEVYRRTGIMPSLGQGSVGAAARKEVLRRAAAQAKAEAQGGTGAGVDTANWADYKGAVRGLGALGARTANIDTAAREASRFGDLALTASGKVERGKFVPINQLFQTVDANLSDPNLKSLKGYLLSLAGAAATVAGRGTTNQFLQEEYINYLRTADSPEALAAAIDVVQQDAEAVVQSTRDVREEMGGALRGDRGNHDNQRTPGAAIPLPPDPTKLERGKVYQTPKGPAKYLGGGQFEAAQ